MNFQESQPARQCRFAVPRSIPREWPPMTVARALDLIADHHLASGRVAYAEFLSGLASDIRGGVTA